MENKRYFNVSDIPETTILTERIMVPYNEMNYCLNGLVMDRVTLLMAPTDSGKTCFSSSFIVSAIKQGYKTFLFAGEDGEDEARDRIYRQFLEFDKENFVYKAYQQNGKDTNTGDFLLKHEKFVEVHNFFKDKLYIYNNEFPANKSELLSTLNTAYEKEGCRFFVIDNCEMFDLEMGDNENKAVKDICIALRRFATTRKVHILLISHIKKVDRTVIRLSAFDNKGTSAITNVCKNIITLIRTDCINTHTKEYREFERDVDNAGYILDDCDAIAEIIKTKGRKRAIIGLGFNRISNSYYEIKKRKEIDPKEKTIQEIIEKSKSNVYSKPKQAFLGDEFEEKAITLKELDPNDELGLPF